MGSNNTQEVFRVASSKELAETGGGHNQKGVDFQRVWALVRMFELEESGAADFLILFEAVQDVAELDSETTPSSIHVYQVKKRDRGEWEWSKLTGLPAPAPKKRACKTTDKIKDSPIGKLYAAVLAFKKLKSSGTFLSNTGCNLPLANCDNAATTVSCDLSQLKAGHLDLLLAGLESLNATGATPANPALIRVEKVPIHPDAPATHLLGVAAAFLNKRSPRHAGQAKSLVDALLAEVGPLGAKTDSCANFDELRMQRGYSRAQFASALGSLEQIADRLKFIEGLDVLLFDEQEKENLKERTQLHRLLAENTWIFGEEFSLSVDDQSLTEVLRKHLATSGISAVVDEPVKRIDGKKGIVDLMLTRNIPCSRENELEQLVIELKRPTVDIGAKELEQIESYAFAVAEDERFNGLDTRWTFWIISNGMDAHAKRRAKQANMPPGLIHQSDDKRISIWAKQWSEVLQANRHRLKLFQQKLEFNADRDGSLGFLRETYANVLSGSDTEVAEV